MANLWGRIMAGLNGFRSGFMSANLSAPDSFVSPDARLARYNFLWALFSNTAYDNSNPTAQSYKSSHGLYRYIRNIYNPASRLAIFYQAHIWGGALDAAAGDGKSAPSSLPIITDQPDALRVAIAQLQLDSNWQTRKDIVTLWGSALGDVGLKVIDDPLRGRVHLDIIHPASIRSLLLDPQGNVKGYEIKEQRADPRPGHKETQSVTYREVASRDGDDVVYQTYLNDAAYAWLGESAEWREPYGFVPLVMIKHNDVGLDFGWSEIQPVIPKAREVDDQASKLNDQVRKMVDAAWFFSGVDDPRKTVKVKGDTPSSATTREPGREEMPAIYGPAGATATPLVAPLDIAAASANIVMMLAELERDLPELRKDIENSSGDASGRALREARKGASNKVQMRRQGYDNALVRAQQMAISIGGMKGYEGYAGYSLDSYDAGKLDHSIGWREVFEDDPLDAIEVQTATWTAAKAAAQAGVPLDIFLRGMKWSESDITAVVSSAYYRDWVASQTGGLG